MRKRMLFLADADLLSQKEFPNLPCYYLSNDYFKYLKIRRRLGAERVNNLAGLFRDTVKEIWESYIELSACLNKKHDTLSWWGKALASRNSMSTQVFLNTVYLFCAGKILERHEGAVVLIIDSSVLFETIEDLAVKRGYEVIYLHGRRKKLNKSIRRVVVTCGRVTKFLFYSLRAKLVIWLSLSNDLTSYLDTRKIVVVQSWVNENNFDADGMFHNRNFGNLAEWLSAHGYVVWNLPFFHGNTKSFLNMRSLIRGCEDYFLMPDQYLKVPDYFRALFIELKGMGISFEGVSLGEHDISKILMDEYKKQCFGLGSLRHSLNYFLLERLQEKGVKINAFYYTFENNPPEKTLIKGVRKFYPDALLFGFQHTVWYTEQCGMFLCDAEVQSHPLPDKIITSGRVYMEVLRKAGFPENIISLGANLRYEKTIDDLDDSNQTSEKIVLLPLSFEKNLSFELIAKVSEALEGLDNYCVHIRPHPFILMKDLLSFLEEFITCNYIVSGEGTLQDNLKTAYVVVSSGCSVTILESAAQSVPVIRVIPDNYFYLDPMAWTDYPLAPVTTPSEIREQLARLLEMMAMSDNEFKIIGVKIKRSYFEPIDKDTLNNFCD